MMAAGSSSCLTAALCTPAGGSGKAEAKGKAQKALKAVKKSSFKRERKPRYSVVFHRPKTLKHSRDPKYPRRRWASLESFGRAAARMKLCRESSLIRRHSPKGCQ
jgi:large subunit ribosomal protein L23Ae